MIDRYLDMTATRGGSAYLLNFFLVSFSAVIVCYGVYTGLHFNHHLFCLSIYMCILIVMVAATILLTQTIRRLNAMGWKGIYSLLIVFPVSAIALQVLDIAFKKANVFPAGPVLYSLWAISFAVLLPLVIVPGRA